MKLVRPNIPVRVRLEVVARQLQAAGKLYDVLLVEIIPKSLSGRLEFLLFRLFNGETYHLDHDPPLCLREIIDPEKGLYSPDANDPRYLTYRTEEDHRLKTYVRGDGAQLSDAGKRRKEIKRQRKELHGFTNGFRRLADRATKAPSRWPPSGSRPLRGRPLR